MKKIKYHLKRIYWRIEFFLYTRLHPNKVKELTDRGLISLDEYLKFNNYVLTCPKCGKALYKYIGNKKMIGLVRAKDFRPLNKKIPYPSPNTKAKCPFCNAAIFLSKPLFLPKPFNKNKCKK